MSWTPDRLGTGTQSQRQRIRFIRVQERLESLQRVWCNCVIVVLQRSFYPSSGKIGHKTGLHCGQAGSKAKAGVQCYHHFPVAEAPCIPHSAPMTTNPLIECESHISYHPRHTFFSLTSVQPCDILGSLWSLSSARVPKLWQVHAFSTPYIAPTSPGPHCCVNAPYVSPFRYVPPACLHVLLQNEAKAANGSASGSLVESAGRQS